MAIEIFEDLEQGSDLWRSIRAGLPTASEFSSILAKGEGKTRLAYLRRLAGEIICGEPEETYSNGHMLRGNAMEDEARLKYALLTNAEPRRIGFVKNHGCGCSPDAFLGDDGLLEVKTAKPSVLIPMLERGTFPPEHVAQVQGALWVTERKWADIIVYWPKMPPLIVRAERDVRYIAELARAVAEFKSDLADLVARIRRMA